MAYDADGLQLTHNGGDSAGIGHYVTDDSQSTVEGSNYFDAASDRLDDKPVLIVTYDYSGTPYTALYKPTVSSGSVTLNKLVEVSKLTDNSGGTADNTIAAVSGSGDDATINDNFADLADAINELADSLGA